MSLPIVLLSAMSVSCAEQSDHLSAASVEAGIAQANLSSRGSVHTVIDGKLVGKLTAAGDEAISITITKGSNASGSIQKFCVLTFEKGVTNPYSRIARELQCYDSTADFISARTEFKNSNTGTVDNITGTPIKKHVGVKLFCASPKSKSTQDPMNCMVRPFLPLGETEPVCKDADGNVTRWGSTYIASSHWLCMGTFVILSKESFEPAPKPFCARNGRQFKVGEKARVGDYHLECNKNGEWAENI